ncbi:hypothetical protein FOZ76_01225 [Verticiella sediminum]|uniref:Uncharacterized protein n=1 Tax=Verticiella sediminum TaxID=1247510 RepID=A0A556B1E5_9BURK|nr:hypothetical protein [Verticiella sediminum]TSH99018.1 hypothetical protein FOZ76_01225 [Verticiella sediminum]
MAAAPGTADRLAGGRRRSVCAGGLALAMPGVAAVLLDGASLTAAIFLSRCAELGFAQSVVAGFSPRAHLLAFPWTSAWMLYACVAGRRASRAALAVLGMLLYMPVLCALAGAFAAAWPPALRAHAFAGTMLVAMVLVHRAAAWCVRTIRLAADRTAAS